MFRKEIKQVGEAGINLFKALWYIIRGKINWKDVSAQIVKTGVGSLFITSITACFIGLAMSLQLSKELRQFGAEQFTGSLISVAIIRELAPVISAIVVAGRVGSAISAELGSMKASEQIDALMVLGIDPIKYLIVPRLLASAVITPLLSTISALVAILAGMYLAKATVNLGYDIYLNGVRLFNNTHDVLVMLLKACVFGIAISIIATTSGLQVKGGAEAVGDAATKTVVWSIILIFIFNFILTSYFFRI